MVTEKSTKSRHHCTLPIGYYELSCCKPISKGMNAMSIICDMRDMATLRENSAHSDNGGVFLR